jgi:predicted nucleotidyltransferase
MPVRSWDSPVLTWPGREAVVRALRAWADGLAPAHPDVLRVGYFGSYARGDAGVGSDLDVVVVVGASDEPPMRRPLAFDTVTGFPVPVDLLVYTVDEWRHLTAGRDPFALRLTAEVAWVTRL